MNTKFQFIEALKDKGWSMETFIKKYNKKLKEMYPENVNENPYLTSHLLNELFENPLRIKYIERALFPALLDISHEDLEKIFPIKI